jgi:hypothetical protein
MHSGEKSRRAVLRLLLAWPARVVVGPLVAVLSMGFARGAAPPADDARVLVRVTTRDVGLLKDFIESNRVEVVRVMLPAPGEPDAVATLLMRHSVYIAARQLPRFKVDVLEEAPRSAADLPPVGRGNRFEDPRTLPQGTGRLVPR